MLQNDIGGLKGSYYMLNFYSSFYSIVASNNIDKIKYDAIVISALLPLFVIHNIN